MVFLRYVLCCSIEVNSVFHFFLQIKLSDWSLFRLKLQMVTHSWEERTLTTPF
jgi:hypothetical protein